MVYGLLVATISSLIIYIGTKNRPKFMECTFPSIARNTNVYLVLDGAPKLFGTVETIFCLHVWNIAKFVSWFNGVAVSEPLTVWHWNASSCASGKMLVCSYPRILVPQLGPTTLRMYMKMSSISLGNARLLAPVSSEKHFADLALYTFKQATWSM